MPLTAGGLLLGTPVDLWLAWACLWGAIPAIALSRLPLGVVAVVAFAVDLVAMPYGAPVIRLGPRWLQGELLGLILGLVPSQLLARWTARDDHLEGRAFLQAVAFSGLVMFVLPAVVIEATGARSRVFNHSAWQIGLMAQMLAAPALIGIMAVQEFATRGRGTPVPSPRLRPWHPPDQPPDKLFVSESCDMCRDVARWFEGQYATHLTIVPAETHPPAYDPASRRDVLGR